MRNLRRFIPVFRPQNAQGNTEDHEGDKKRRRTLRIAGGVGCLIIAFLFIAYVCGWIPYVKQPDHEWRTDLTNIVIAVFSIILAFVTYLQWDVMAEQNDAIEQQLEQFKLDQRAWVAVEGAEIGRPEYDANAM